MKLGQYLKRLSPARRKRVEQRAAQLIAEEMTLRERRKARPLTQAGLAEALGITQDQVSRLEKRKDLRVSPLVRAAESLGGRLSLVAKFPDQEPVILSGLADKKQARLTAGASSRPSIGSTKGKA